MENTGQFTGHIQTYIVLVPHEEGFVVRINIVIIPQKHRSVNFTSIETELLFDEQQQIQNLTFLSALFMRIFLL